MALAYKNISGDVVLCFQNSSIVLLWANNGIQDNLLYLQYLTTSKQ